MNKTELTVSAGEMGLDKPERKIHPAADPLLPQAERRPAAGGELLTALGEHRRAAGIFIVSSCALSAFGLVISSQSAGLLILLNAVCFSFLGAYLLAVLLAPQLQEVAKSLAKSREREEGDPTLTDLRAVSPTVDILQTLKLEARLIERLISCLKLERDTIYARHELITTNIAASVIIRDTAGKILFCSPYTQVLTGYSLEDIYDCETDFFEKIVVDEDKPRYLRAQKVSALAEDISVKYRIMHRSGLKIWLETRLVPVLDDDGELVSVMSVALDVTDTLSYQKQIEEQNQDLSDFAYMVSHDLKAPIFTIKGMATALLEDHQAVLGKSGEELIQYIIDATQRLEKLVASVIEYSAITTKEAQETQVDLNQTLLNVKADMAELAKNKQAQLNIEPGLPSVQGNPVRLYQVFSNLVGNALKYSSPARTPEISISRRKTAGNSLIIEIADNGLGIPQQKVSDIFRPYHRAHGNQIEGSGIGLACVKKIMEQLGGSVSVQTTEGKGSVFTLSFPPPPPKPREIPVDLLRCFEQ